MHRRDFIKNASIMGLAASPLASANVLPTSRLDYRRQSVKISPAIEGDLQFSKAEYDRRYRGIRAAMEAEGIGALVVVGTKEWSGGDTANIHYLGAPTHMAEHSLMVLPLESDPITPYSNFGFPTMPPLPPGKGPFVPKIPSPVKFNKVNIPVREQALVSPDYAAGVVQMLKSIGLTEGKVGFASMKNVPADIYAAVTANFPKLEIVEAQHIFLSMRLYKSEEEIAFMRRSGFIADRGFEAMLDTADVGVSDYDVFYAIDKACAMAGAPVGGFQLYGSGPWEGPPGSTSNLILYPGSARTIQKGDMLIPEIGSNYKGYFTQLTVPASVGEPSESFLEVYELCKKVHAAIRAEFRPGKTVRELDAFSAEITEELSSGEYTTLFGIQAGEHEYSFWHLDYELKPGAMAYNQPFFFPKKRRGGPFHVFGDAMVMTNDAPIILHQSKMDLVII